MAMKTLPDQDVLLQLLDYDPQTGNLTWKPRGLEWFPGLFSEATRNSWNVRCAGKLALHCLAKEGYRTGSIQGVPFRAHRVIWKMVTGTEADHIDHINGDKADNRIANLRSVTQHENMRNKALPKTNTSGVIGVSRWQHRGYDLWVAKIKQKTIGYFDSFDDAVAARKAAEIAHDFHPNHGRAA